MGRSFAGRRECLVFLVHLVKTFANAHINLHRLTTPSEVVKISRAECPNAEEASLGKERSLSGGIRPDNAPVWCSGGWKPLIRAFAA